MYEAFYGLTDKPFSMLPDPGFLYLGKQHQTALTMLEYALINDAGFCVVTGEPGAGKTTLLRKILETVEEDKTVGMITNTHKSFGEMLDWVLAAYSIHETGLNQVEKNQKFIDFLLDQYASGKSTLLIVDEAQNMSIEMLEELRMLSNVNSEKDQVLQVILAGQPALKETLRQPELTQFVQRIGVDYHLGTLDFEETFRYIHHRLMKAGATRTIFTPLACERVYEYSGGVPRLINLICDTVMVYGFADQIKLIGEDIVDEMVSERMQDSVVPLYKKPPERKSGPSIRKSTSVPTDISAPSTEDIAEKVQEKSITQEQSKEKLLEELARHADEINEKNRESTQETEALVKDESEEQQSIEEQSSRLQQELDPALEQESQDYEVEESEKSKQCHEESAGEALFVSRVEENSVVKDNDRATAVSTMESNEADIRLGLFNNKLSLVTALVFILLVTYVVYNQINLSKTIKQAELELQDTLKKQQEQTRKIKRELEQSKKQASEQEQSLKQQAELLQKQRDEAVEKAQAEAKARDEQARQARLERKQQEIKRIELQKKTKEAARLAKEKQLAEQRAKEEAERIAQEKAELEAKLAKNQNEMKKMAEQQAAARAQEEASIIEDEKNSIALQGEGDEPTMLILPADEQTEFASDPCTGPSARFLSTCR